MYFTTLQKLQIVPAEVQSTAVQQNDIFNTIYQSAE